MVASPMVPVAGQFCQSISKDAVLAEINAKWDNKKKAAIGYIGLTDGALPSLR